jgi:hypothetical protein
MKFNFTVEVDDFDDMNDLEDEIRSNVVKLVSQEVVQNLRSKEMFKGLHSWDSEIMLRDAFDRQLNKVRPAIEARIVESIENKLLTKNEMVKTLVGVKEFNELSKENVAYLGELIDKAIARKFK